MSDQPNIFLSTPCYGGMCSASYASFIMSLTDACREAGFGLTVSLTGNESLITRARNKSVARFLLTDCTHLLFFDADQSIHGKDVVDMVRLDRDVLGAPVPMKMIDWPAVRQAVEDGVEDEDLASSGAKWAFNFLSDQPHELTLEHGCAEVSMVGTGCMLIKRSVIEKMMEAYPDTRYISDGFDDRGRTIYALFDCFIDRSKPESPRYLSEDYGFCKRWRDIGGKVHLYLPAKVTHHGSYVYQGDVMRLFEGPAKEAVE